MVFDYQYKGVSTVVNDAANSTISFVPDATREPTFFDGRLASQHSVLFREAISALHHVVTDDQRYVAPDKTEYLLWRKEQDLLEFQQLLAQELGIETSHLPVDILEQPPSNDLKARLQFLTARQKALQEEMRIIEPQIAQLTPWKKIRQYYQWAAKRNRAATFLLDPVITVHPDNIFFECFSLDESSYGKLSCDYELFNHVGDFSCGTTNIDYSHALYNEFQKIRDYKESSLIVDPGGFTVQTEGEEDFREVKIDLPESWVRGFLQVSSAMVQPATLVELDPLDVHAICLFLKKNREKHGPRSIRFQLGSDGSVQVQFDPWGTKIECTRSRYFGSEKQEIRVWGRRRLHILERLIPITQKFHLHLLGEGMPYFFVADLGGLHFTLGLSGWSGNNFSQGANFDLLAPRDELPSAQRSKVFAALTNHKFASAAQLATELNMTTEHVISSLTAYIQAGRVVYDLQKNVYRLRELSRDPLDADALRFSSPQEELAMDILNGNRLSNITKTTEENGTRINGTVTGTKGGTYSPSLLIDSDGRIRTKDSTCNCEHFYKNGSKSGPCEHMLALRVQCRRTGQ